MNPSRPWFGLLVLGILFVCVLAGGFAGLKTKPAVVRAAQPPAEPAPILVVEEKKQPAPAPLPVVSSVRFIEDSTARRVLAVARDCIQDKDWELAFQAIQPMLDQKNDAYFHIRERDPADPKKEITRWTSAKREANSLLASLPANALHDYEKAHGSAAKKLFDDAKKKDDVEKLRDVAIRYRHTKAGSEAYAIVAKQIKDIPAAEVNVKDWRSWRGNTTNTGQTIGTPPLLDKKLWSRPLMMDKHPAFPEVDDDKGALTLVAAAIKQANEAKRPVLPGFFPIATKNLIVYRSQLDIRALALKEMEQRDPDTGFRAKFMPGDIIWKSIPMNRSLSMLTLKNNTRPKVKEWLDDFDTVPGFSSFVYDNTLIGTLTADDQYVYAINDLAVPPHPGVFVKWLEPTRYLPGDVKPLLLQNELHAYDVVSGKLKWDLIAEDADFRDSHFVSLPINVGGKLYVLNEKMIQPVPNVDPFGGGWKNRYPGDSELRLICIDPKKIVLNANAPKPTIVSITTLANVVQDGRFLQDIGRRVNAAQLAYSDGILVCPTNAGDVLGIDLLTRSIAWSYSYRESPHLPMVLPGMIDKVEKPLVGTTTIAKWKSAPAAIQDGKIVFTAPDADSVHCINLRDGKLVWKHKQQNGDLYFAGVVDGRALIVGTSVLRALELKTGNQLWTIPTGDLPSGQGATASGIYYLPLKKGELLAVDIAKGIVKAHLRAKAGPDSLGNLVFHDGMVLSQTPTEVSAYPQLGAKLGEK